MIDVTLGAIVATSGVAALIKSDTAFGEAISDILGRHKRGDWGVVAAEDAKSNNEAVENGGRLLSAYDVEGTRVWIITEADRSYTTVLLPEEY